MTDKRKFHRWPCSFPCDTKIESSQFKGTVSDLSYGGARVEQTSTLPIPGNLINLTIFPDGDGEGTPLQAKVAHVSEENLFFGVQFFGNSDEMNERLSLIIDEKLAIQHNYSFSFQELF